MQKRLLCTLQFESTDNYKENLQTLTDLIKETPDNTIILAPEVCLTNFDYEHFEAASAFSSMAIDSLLPLSKTRIIVLTVIEKRENGKFFNVAKVLFKEKVVHEQCKNKLFKLGDEHKYFTAGKDERLSLFEIEGIRFGLMICFELRFKQYWQDLEGADIILVPSRWGRNRTENFKVLTESLAVMNQCYVLGADAANEDCTSMSGIISPFGKAVRNGNALCLLSTYDKQEIRRMRRYLDVGI
ncbi:carbon-nitrogen hydrolase family protein [Campylobacterota bacterium]